MKGPTNIFINLSLLACLLSVSSCSNFLTDRTFIDEMEFEDSAYWVPGEDFSLTTGDSGQAYRTREEIYRRTPASRYEQQSYEEAESLRRELMRRESMLSEHEFSLYREIQDSFANDSQRIYYLSLSPYERETYLQSKGQGLGSGRSPASLSYEAVPKFHQMETLDLISPSASYYGPEINMGMAKDQVVEIWGRPARIDVAGDPRQENERWSFYQNGRMKTIYFEGGQVQGWSLQ